jgi:hypothetical protein
MVEEIVCARMIANKKETCEFILDIIKTMSSVPYILFAFIIIKLAILEYLICLHFES